MLFKEYFLLSAGIEPIMIRAVPRELRISVAFCFQKKLLPLLSEHKTTAGISLCGSLVVIGIRL